MACKNVRVKGYHVKAKKSGKHKHKGYKVPGHTRKVCS